MKIQDTALYLTDNGACYCGEHLGTMARMTGHDISGQPIYRVTQEDAKAAHDAYGVTLACEQPRCGRSASLLHVA